MCAAYERLIYQSDFTVPSKGWVERITEKSTSFRRDGYFHIGVHPPGIEYHGPALPVVDFRVHVDMGFAPNSGSTSSCGIIFRADLIKEGTFYALIIYTSGGYCIYYYCKDKWEPILLHHPSPLIKNAPDINAWTVEMIGQKITVEVNGHVLTTIMDDRLEVGFVGVFVSPGNEYAEARFSDFRLYSIEPKKAVEIEAVEIDKVTYEKTPPQAPQIQKPSVSPGSQIPQDVYAFLAGILKEAGMTDLDEEMREEMIKELSDRLNTVIIGEIVDHMPDKYLDTFIKMNKQNRPKREIEAFIKEHVPNAEQVFANAFVKFRKLYVDKGT